MRHASVLRIAAFLITGSLVAACGGGGGGGGTSGGFIGGGGGGGGGGTAIASLLISVNGTLTAGTPVTLPVTVTAKDVNGNVIAGTYASTVTLTDSDLTGATTVTPGSVTNASTAIQLHYNGSGGFTGSTITASTVGNVQASIPVALAGTCSAVAGVNGYIPCDLQDAYSLPISAGVGQTVGIVDAYNDPNAEADLAVYRAKFGLPACTTLNGCFRKVNQSGQQSNYPPNNTGWATEESLDIDMVSAVCPNCHILLVEATSNSGADLDLAVDEAATLGATEISNSYGGGEDPSETTVDDPHFNHPGIAITASSGDGGYAAGTSYPASSQYVTAVGGTALVTAANSRGWSESVWNTSSSEGAGSGCSAYETKPAWQLDSGCAKRMVADVSAVADPATGVAVYDTFGLSGWKVFGGTSVSSPIIAAIYALAGNAASVNYGSFPYSHTASLNDVTVGNNGTCSPSPAYFCTAEVGYDGPTGLGTPNGTGGLGAFVGTMELRIGSPHRAILPGIGARTRRSCNTAQRGYFACYAIEVVQ